MKKKFYVGQFVYLYLIGDAAENKKVSERIKTCEVLYVLDGKNITVQPEGSTHKWVLGIESDLCGSQEVNRFNGADYLLYLSKEEIIDRIAQKYGYKKRVENCIVLGIITEYVKDRHVVTASRVGCAERWYKDIDEVIEEIKTICYEEVCELSGNSQIARICRCKTDRSKNLIPYDIWLFDDTYISLYADGVEYMEKCTIEELKSFDKEILGYKMFGAFCNREDVVRIEGCGESGFYPWHTWYVATLADGEEISVYTKL